MKSKWTAWLVLSLLTTSAAAATDSATNSGYLFTSFRDNGQDGLRFLYSFNGYYWSNVPGTFLKPDVGPSKLMRDPSLVRGPDGTYHLVWTTGWHTDQGFGCASTKDLAHWTEQRFIPVMAHEPTTVNVWAPELFYDERESQFIVCWASTIPGRFPDFEEPPTNNHRMYYTTTRDFKDFAPAKLFFDPGFSVIDGCVVRDGGRYVLIHKDNSRPKLNLRVAFGDTPLGPWRDVSPAFTDKFTEGPTALKIGEDWIIYYDAYRAKRYGAAKTRDFKTFTDISGEVAFPEGHKHGTALRIERAELDRLLKAALLAGESQTGTPAGGSGPTPGTKTNDARKSGRKKANDAATTKTPEEVEADYTRSIEGRTKDILVALDLKDAGKAGRVHDAIMAQYRALRAWHDTNDPALKTLGKELSKGDQAQAAQTQNQINQINSSLKTIHRGFVGKLSVDLTPQEVETVKDKMTYNKVKVTYDAYLDIVPNLTEPEKGRMLEFLKEAREEAMDCGSVDEKSAVFKKYKGKINNYLSQQGHDVGKAYKDWGEKQKAKSKSDGSGKSSSLEKNAVDPAALQHVYDQAKTPFKYGIVLRGTKDERVDCPNVFHHGSNWFMVYIAFDGQGYETRLARSADLLHWDSLGPILKRHGSGWDAEQAAAGLALIDYRWDGTWELQKYEGRYWLSYIGGEKKGYETPPLSIGMASTDDPASPKEWTRLDKNPVLRPGDGEAREFERDTLFKSYILRDTDKTLGAEFVMFYNARKPKDSERIGIATSRDLKTWDRLGKDPVLENARPEGLKHGVISGDPQVLKMGDLWVMFYFGAFWKPGAFDTFAASRDLVHWTKWTGPDLIAPSETWDKEFAHKPWLVRDKGVVYHFYCAVGDQGRVIAVATSADLRRT